jgi:hypothetical protein
MSEGMLVDIKVLASKALIALTITAACAGAQTSDAATLLARPPFNLCRAIQPTESDSADVIFEFATDDTSNATTLMSAYTTAGSPRYLAIRRTEPKADAGNRTHVLAVNFGSVLRSTYAVVESDSLGQVISTQPSPKGRSLVDAEVAAARNLSEWLWANRCRRGPTQ